MVNSSELRIGNAVNITYKDTKKTLIISIGLPDLNLIHNRDSVNEYSPIELNHLILITCGFNLYQDEYLGGIYSISYYPCIGSFNEFMSIQYSLLNNNLYVNDTDDGVGSLIGNKIIYLHELQNVFRWVTGKELEVNLNERQNTNTQTVL